MCGIAGYWQGHIDPDLGVARRMADQLHHRGPDDAGVWADANTGLALAHRRLAVVELSAAGQQPMVSACGRFVLIYNGEIYNHLELRHDLEQELGTLHWHGRSDTESLLAALSHWGIEGALKRANGMFAFALWDRHDQTLHLARDRMGEKPLYYGRVGGVFMFGSELKALRAHPSWRGEIDRNALRLYLRHNYVPSPWSIYRGIFKLRPSHYVTVHAAGNEISPAQCYWDLEEIAAQGVSNPRDESSGLIEELDTLLRDAVGRRMEADVALGAFLSGGYDSTTIVAIMQSLSTSPVKTFSIGFHDDSFDEARYAKAIATHLGTEHTELYVTPAEAIAVIPQMPRLWDEPFADSSQIPTYLVSRLARQHVTVALSGDGGDELFCGYNRYALAHSIWRTLGRLPVSPRRGIANLLDLASPQADHLMGLLPKQYRVQHAGDRLPKLARLLRSNNATSFYSTLISGWDDLDNIMIGGDEPKTLFNDASCCPSLTDLRDRMMYLDSMVYLPDDILTKVDRASMAVSLEARVPLLDHRLVEFSWRVPKKYKVRDGEGKWLLRQVLHRYVPHEMMGRPKHGFGVPIGGWLRGPLLNWAEELLDEKRLREEGFFHSDPIRHHWHEHKTGKRRWHSRIWSILMFQAWLEAQQRTNGE